MYVCACKRMCVCVYMHTWCVCLHVHMCTCVSRLSKCQKGFGGLNPVVLTTPLLCEGGTSFNSAHILQEAQLHPQGAQAI